MQPLSSLTLNIYADEKGVLQWCQQQRDWRHENPEEAEARWGRGEEMFAWRNYVIRAVGTPEGTPERSYVVRRT